MASGLSRRYDRIQTESNGGRDQVAHVLKSQLNPSSFFILRQLFSLSLHVDAAPRARAGNPSTHATFGPDGPPRVHSPLGSARPAARRTPLSLSLHAPRPDPRPLLRVPETLSHALVYTGTRCDRRCAMLPQVGKVDPFSLTTDAAGHLYSYSTPVFGFLNHRFPYARPVFQAQQSM